jgi:flagellar hook-length control protein FliK
VRLDVSKDGRIISHVIADNKDTPNLLQRDASGLQRAFQDAGLKTADNGLQFSLRDQSGGQQQNPGANTNSAQIIVQDDSLPPIDATSGSYSRPVRLNGGLDIRV